MDSLYVYILFCTSWALAYNLQLYTCNKNPIGTGKTLKCLPVPKHELNKN